MKKRDGFEPMCGWEEALLLRLCSHHLTMYNIQQDLTFLNLSPDPLQGAASDEPEAPSVKGSKETLCWDLCQPPSLITGPCFISIPGHTC